MIKCPVCGESEFEKRSDYDVCEVCGWENDGLQMSKPDYGGGANGLSLNQYKAEWEKLRQNKEYMGKLDRSLQQVADGHVVVKTMEELEDMEDME
jgi:hypothetical protein